MTYKSHRTGASRVFDHLYDPIYTTSASNLRRENYKSLSKSAPLHVCPIFRTMFTELIRERRNYYFPQRNPLPYSSEGVVGAKLLCDRAINTNNYLSFPKRIVENQFLQIYVHPEQKTSKSVECQTTYRESSAQTDPWLPEARVRDGVRKIPEIAIVGPITDPNLYEVETIERARKRREWEQNLPMISSKDDIPNRLLALESFEYEDFMAKEKFINETQEERLKIVLKLMEKRHERNHKATTNKLENSYKRITSELEKQKNQLSVNYQRKMRMLKKICSDKGFTTKQDFVMPKLEGNQGDLMKEYEGLLNFRSNQKPRKRVKKQRELWEPKGRCIESQHGIRSVDNLKNLVEVMKHSRTEKSSSRPECMVVRKDYDETDDIFHCCSDITYDRFYQDTLLIQKIIKGRSVQNILYSGINENIFLIHELMESQPIKSVLELFPERILIRKEAEELAERVKVEQDQEAADIIEEKLKKEQIIEKLNHEFSELMDSLDAIIFRVTLDKFNKQILRDADKARNLRREEAQEKARLAEKSLKLRTEIQRQRDESQLKTIDGFMEVMIPQIIEKIADNEAKDYITKVAKIIDQEASKSLEFTNNENHNRTIIFNLLREFLIPEVSKRIERQKLKDFQLICLLSAHDALYQHLDELPLDEIHDCKIISQDIVEEIIKDLPLIA